MIMPVAKERGRHTPPLPEGVRAVQRRSLDQHIQWARPRSAVTVSPTAPRLSPLTGFSRSGRSAALVRLVLHPMYPFGLSPSLGFTADGLTLGSVPVTVMSDNVVQVRCHRPGGRSSSVHRASSCPRRRAVLRSVCNGQYNFCKTPARRF